MITGRISEAADTEIRVIILRAPPADCLTASMLGSALFIGYLRAEGGAWRELDDDRALRRGIRQSPRRRNARSLLGRPHRRARPRRIRGTSSARVARPCSPPMRFPATSSKGPRHGRCHPTVARAAIHSRACEWYSELGTKPSALEMRLVMLNMPMTWTASMIS